MPEPSTSRESCMVARRIKTRARASSGATTLWGQNLRGGSYARQPHDRDHLLQTVRLGLRAGWMAQELLTTFAEELGSVTLTPDGTGGVFEVRVNNEVIWSRKEQGRFPELKEIKQLIRDRVAPGRSLGHTDSA